MCMTVEPLYSLSFIWGNLAVKEMNTFKCGRQSAFSTIQKAPCLFHPENQCVLQPGCGRGVVKPSGFS